MNKILKDEIYKQLKAYYGSEGVKRIINEIFTEGAKNIYIKGFSEAEDIEEFVERNRELILKEVYDYCNKYQLETINDAIFRSSNYLTRREIELGLLGMDEDDERAVNDELVMLVLDIFAYEETKLW